jgi:lysophospholipase L1-like esterase
MNLRPTTVLFISIGLSLIIAEMALRASGVMRTRSEMAGIGWSVEYGCHPDNLYRIYPPNYSFRNSNPDFDFEHTTNALGFVGPMPDKVKQGRRIIFFGDSFAEGVGAASPDSSCPKLLQGILGMRYSDTHTEVLNFGVGGSDVIYATKYLRDSTARFSPDLVILMYNNSDVFDIIQRGGKERFQADGTTRFRSGPWFLPLFRYSHLVRLIVVNGFQYDAELLIPNSEVKAEIEWSWGQAIAGGIEAKQICDEMGADFLFVLMPFWTELTNQRAEVSKQFSYMREALDCAGVPTLNLYDSMSQVINRDNFTYYSWWKHDGHFKRTGYQLMAGIVADSEPVWSIYSVPHPHIGQLLED